MLVSLRFKNIALLNSQELAFSKGFTVITGETGAGKSILIDAIDILLGGGQPATSTRLLNSGKESFLIEAIFSLTPEVIIWLKNQEICFDDNEVIVSREWRLKDNRLKSILLPIRDGIMISEKIKI